MDMSRTPAVAHIDDVLHIVQKIGALDPQANAKIVKYMQVDYPASSRLHTYLEGADNIVTLAALMRSPAFLGEENSSGLILSAVRLYFKKHPDIAERVELNHRDWTLVTNRMISPNPCQTPYPSFM